ncbi:universal stress protein [Halorubrum sp. HHNYT27]|uniref:universal stress protein n=1 Tax=Halorubrum sp. HHNYT27 TaxID=3402275 RepID=UPI003EC0EB15
MTLYDRILVPTDGSAEGERAVAHALDLAAVHDADVHAIHVVDTASYAGMSMEVSWEGLGELLRSDAAGAVEAVEELAAGTAIDVDTAVVEGSPSREIVRYAEAHDCDLVVMGTHGRGGIDRLLLGSVAETVVRAASVPVLTVQIDDDAAGPERPATAVESGAGDGGADEATVADGTSTGEERSTD